MALSTCLPVCPCLYVRRSQLCLPCSHYPIFMTQQTFISWDACSMLVSRSTGHTGRSKSNHTGFGRARSVAPFIYGTYESYEATVCRAHFSSQKFKGQGRSKSSPYPLSGSTPIWPNPFIWSTNVIHEGRCATHHFQVKRSKVKVTEVVHI